MFSYHGLESSFETQWRLGHMFFVQRDDESVVEDARQWCVENFGDSERWMRTSFHIIVFGDIDAIAFRLRWC